MAVATEMVSEAAAEFALGSSTLSASPPPPPAEASIAPANVSLAVPVLWRSSSTACLLLRPLRVMAPVPRMSMAPLAR